MAKWEYTGLILEVRAKKFGEGLEIIFDDLSTLGEQGWEICASSEVTGADWTGNITARTNVIFLKREIRPAE